jgi:hypothetical protein
MRSLSETPIVSSTMHKCSMQLLMRNSFIPRERVTCMILGGTV